MTVELIHGDGLALADRLRGQRVAIVTDPPWGVNQDTSFNPAAVAAQAWSGPVLL
jgi:hypothetical protein